MNNAVKIKIVTSFFFLTTILLTSGFSQTSYESLTRVQGTSETVYASKGHEQLGKHLATLVEEATLYLSDLVGKPAPKTTLLVLSQEDWGKFTNPQIIYVMPHYGGINAGNLIVAAEDNYFWRANMPPMDQLSAEQQQIFRDVYTNEAGELSVQAFFNLLALHELGHGRTPATIRSSASGSGSKRFL